MGGRADGETKSNQKSLVVYISGHDRPFRVPGSKLKGTCHRLLDHVGSRISCGSRHFSYFSSQIRRSIRWHLPLRKSNLFAEFAWTLTAQRSFYSLASAPAMFTRAAWTSGGVMASRTFSTLVAVRHVTLPSGTMAHTELPS